MSGFVIGCLIIVVYICLYTIIDRICRCKEHCATANSFNKYVEAGNKLNESEEN